MSALNDGEKSARAALQYADKSPQADKHCDICNFYQAASDPAACGGCQLVKGPIHPKGYCTAFAAKT
ncbi:MAG TPA: high-potential iron-sulfur protein [Polyangiales bacterium]